MKAIESADLGLNPMSDGNVIRINVPPPSQERRRQLVGQVRKMAEDTRVAVRNERPDANKKIDQLAVRLSNATGHNLVPWFQTFRFPLSLWVPGEVDHLPPWDTAPF